MPILRALTVRLLQGCLLVLAVVVLNFMLVHAAPGDPVETIAGASGGMSPELMAQLRTQYGLDRPMLVQLGIYLSRVLSGDLGYSYFFNLPVAQMIFERIPATLLLVVSAVLLAFVAGTLLGVLSARRPNGLLSQCITVLSLVGFAAPVFWTGMMLVLLFASWLPILPVSGMRSADSSGSGGLADMLDVLQHLVLPMLTLSWSTWRSTAGWRARRCWTCWARTTSARHAPRACPTAWCSTSTRCATRCCRWSRCWACSSAT